MHQTQPSSINDNMEFDYSFLLAIISADVFDTGRCRIEACLRERHGNKPLINVAQQPAFEMYSFSTLLTCEQNPNRHQR
jgi:hypothetical protein